MMRSAPTRYFFKISNSYFMSAFKYYNQEAFRSLLIGGSAKKVLEES